MVGARLFALGGESGEAEFVLLGAQTAWWGT